MPLSPEAGHAILPAAENDTFRQSPKRKRGGAVGFLACASGFDQFSPASSIEADRIGGEIKNNGNSEIRVEPVPRDKATLAEELPNRGEEPVLCVPVRVPLLCPVPLDPSGKRTVWSPPSAAPWPTCRKRAASSSESRSSTTHRYCPPGRGRTLSAHPASKEVAGMNCGAPDLARRDRCSAAGRGGEKPRTLQRYILHLGNTC